MGIDQEAAQRVIVTRAEALVSGAGEGGDGSVLVDLIVDAPADDLPIGIGFMMLVGIAWVMVLSAGTGDDSAGPVMIGFIGTFASSVVAAVALVLQTQVQRAIDTKKGPTATTNALELTRITAQGS
jgi:hypothetical protein